MKNVTERSLNLRLRKGIILSLITGFLLLGLAGIMVLMMQDSLENIVNKEMRIETAVYKKRLLKQIDKEFETLETLAEVFSHGDMTNSQWFDKCLYDSNQKNSFIVTSFFNKDGIGTLAYTGVLKKNVNYRNLNENIFEPVEKAMEGERSISRLFQSAHVEEKIFAYSVPVYNDSGSEVIGVLIAGNNVETFQELIDYEGYTGKKHAVHLVSGDGRMLLSNSFKDLSEMPEDIFHEDSYFTKEEQTDIEMAIKKEEPLFTHMKYMGIDYKVCLTPIGVNNWYMMYVNNAVGVNKVAFHLVYVTGVVFLLLLGIILFMLGNTCLLIAKNNKKLIGLAYRDGLTASDNIVRFNQKLSMMKEKSGFCLVAINIRQFKFVNEIFGVKAADRLLKEIVKELREFVGEEEFFCRETGDLFYLCLKETEEKVIRERVEGLLDRIAGKKLSAKTDYQLMVYAGAIICHENVNLVPTNELLITRVRFAMSSCKKHPSERIHFYDTEIHKSEVMANYVETHMQRALERGEFKLYLQPKRVLGDRTLGGAEALVRWVTEEGKMLYPDMFIPQFERNGFCVQLDMYMVEQACRLIRSWMDKGIEPISISVNQSKLVFFDSDYLTNLQKLIDKYQIPSSLITLEILEGLALEHGEEVNEKLRSLRAMGFRISMDDFGSGYSSFNTLGNLEIDELKLDRSFLLEASSSKGNRFFTIMAHIIQLSKSLHIDTVAEGVETLENEEMIRSLGCDFGQGYLYSRPISAEEFSRKYME